MTADTILHRLMENGRKLKNVPAYFVKSNDVWTPTSWGEYAAEVRQAAKALIALGFRKGGSVCMLGFNRPEWVIFDLAGMLAGGHSSGIYTSNSPAEVQYIVEHSGAGFILLEDENQWKKIDKVRDQLPELKNVVMMKDVHIDDSLALDWETFMAKGDEISDETLDERLNGLELDQLATLIYTSGTTGPPKGVMLSHRNLVWTADTAAQLLNITPDDSELSYLPLSHIAEQMFTIHGAITAGYKVYFAQSPPQIHLNDNFKEIQPTIVFGVPRIWERFAAAVQANLAQNTGAKAKIADWAQSVGRRVSDLKNMSQEPTGGLAIQYKIADRLVFSKVKEALGMTNARFCITAAAPIAPEIIRFFNDLDLPMFELYGQSEDTGPTTTNRPGANKIGTVGQNWPGTEVKLGDDGEILVKGPNVFLGYYKDPASTASDLVDGWLYSGDLGEFDEDGFLTIVGRKKEIIITSGGKNIAPKNIEAALKNLPLVSQAVVIGEKRRYITALLTLDPDPLAKFVQENNLEGQEIHANPVLIERIKKDIEKDCNSLFARVEQVRDFRILHRDFTVEDGELTPTLKIKRRIINENFADLIESMYPEE